MLVLPLGIAWFTALTLALLDGRRGWVSHWFTHKFASLLPATTALRR